MINYIKRAISLVIVLVLAFGVVGALAGCDDGEKDPPPAEDVYYTVAFNVNCDEDVRTPASQNVKAGEKATRPQDPYRAGYKIEGWYTEEACTNLFDFDTPINAHKTLYAKWEDATVRFTVTYEYNGGTGTTASETVEAGGKATRPEDPTKEKMYFDGWYQDKETKRPYNFDSAVQSDITIYAKWLKAITVTYDYNYTGAPAPLTEEIKEGEVAPKKNVDRHDYIFGGWYLDDDCENGYRDTPVSDDLTLYAGWVSLSAQDFTYTFHYNYSGAPANVEVSVKGGAQVEAPDFSENAPEGKEFAGWFKDAAGEEEFDIYAAATGDADVYAKWANLYTVTFNYNCSTIENTTATVREGKPVQEPEIPERNGCTFVAWFTEATLSTEYEFSAPVTGNMTLYAGWQFPNDGTYVFEAEYTDLTGVTGKGYSNEAAGTNMIQKDGNPTLTKASNGFWVGFLNKTGAALTFHIHADNNVNDATLILRLSGEHTGGSPGIYFTDEEFLVTVNGQKVSYGSLQVNTMFVQDTMKMPFQDFTVAINLSLNAGDNEIKLLVNNSRKPEAGGTMSATAPMVDCIKIVTQQAVLSWDPKEENLDGKR